MTPLSTASRFRGGRLFQNVCIQMWVASHGKTVVLVFDSEFSNWTVESHTPLIPLSRGDAESFIFVNFIHHIDLYDF